MSKKFDVANNERYKETIKKVIEMSEKGPNYVIDNSRLIRNNDNYLKLEKGSVLGIFDYNLKLFGIRVIDGTPNESYYDLLANAKEVIAKDELADSDNVSDIYIADVTSEVGFAETGDMCEESSEDEDSVNHPSHYNYGPIEVIDYINQTTNGYTDKGHVAYCIGNVIKYVSRAPFKNGKQDLEKAQWYLSEAIKKY